LVQFKVICSSGTYIRTLINDLGETLGVWATAVELKRTRIGEYRLEDVLSSKDIKEDMNLELIKIKLNT
jgi:tRNA pseudouridine55 synthase